MLDPMAPLTLTEKLVFGADAVRHPIAGFVIERGSGALPVAAQLANYIRTVEQTEGTEAAEKLRVRCRAIQLCGLVTVEPRQA